MNNLLVESPKDAYKVLDLLATGARRRNIVEGFRLDETIVSRLDPLKFLRAIYSLSDDSKSVISYWCRCGTLVGVCVEGLLTPSGSVLIDLTTFRRSKSIIDLPALLERLEKLGICIIKKDLAYLPGFFYFSDHVALTTQSELFEHRVDEIVSLSGEIEFSRLHMPLPASIIVSEKATLQEAYADAISLLKKYFFSEITSFAFNLVSIPSVTPLVLEFPVDLVVTTKYDIIAHKFVNVDRTFRRGFTSVLKYSEYGFDKVVLVHYSEHKLSSSLCRSTLIALLTRPLLQWVGYVVVRGYEIDELLVLKVPTYNRSVELYGSRGQFMKSLLRSYLKAQR